MLKYDSTESTNEHIQDVRLNISSFCVEMTKRAVNHDKSKLESPEKELFDKFTPILQGLEYGSTEYFESLSKLKVAIDHHYKNNSHHPEHYKNGINGFDLFDLVEMYCDWQAAVKRTKDGSFFKSLLHNSTRFSMSEQLVDIFKNTHERSNK